MTTMPQRESTIAVPDDRRKQLGAFLRARRESLRSAAHGVAPGGPPAHAGSAPGRGGDARRRRRYLVHRLEQGREVNPSEAVLVGVANALQCSPLETRHLFVLAGLTPPEATR